MLLWTEVFCKREGRRSKITVDKKLLLFVIVPHAPRRGPRAGAGAGVMESGVEWV